MQARLNAYELAPEIQSKAAALQQAIDAIGVDKTVIELLKIRVSQINGCAYCLNMHTRDARKHGESEMRLYLLSAWRESTLFSERERAVLAWAEALAHLPERGAPEALFQELKRHFSDQEIVGLTCAVAMINFWNRLAVGFGNVWPGESSGARTER